VDVPEVLDLVDDILQERPLGVLRRDFFNRAVEDCVGPKKDKDSIPHSVQYQVDRATDTLVSRAKGSELDEEEIMTQVMKFGAADAEEDYDAVQNAWHTARYQKLTADDREGWDGDGFTDSDGDSRSATTTAAAAAAPPSRSRAASKKPGAKKTVAATSRAKSRGKAKAATKPTRQSELDLTMLSRGRKRKPVNYALSDDDGGAIDDDDDDDYHNEANSEVLEVSEDESEPEALSTKPRRRGKAKAIVIDYNDDESAAPAPVPPKSGKAKRVIPGRSKRQRR